MPTSAELHGERNPERRTAGRRQLSHYLCPEQFVRVQSTIDTPYMGVPDGSLSVGTAHPMLVLAALFRSWPRAPATTPHFERG